MKTSTSVSVALLATAVLYGAAVRADDRALTVFLTTGTGAAIGHSIGGRDGAAIGAATGALVGISMANQQPAPYYGRPPARVAYAPPQQYYQPAPVPTYQQQYEQHYQMLNPQTYGAYYQPVYAPVVRRPVIAYPVSVHYQRHVWKNGHHHGHHGHRPHDRYGYGR